MVCIVSRYTFVSSNSEAIKRAENLKSDTMIAKIFELAEKMKIGVSRSVKNNTWTMTHVAEFGLTEEVFEGDAKSFLRLLKTRFEICNN